MNKRQPLIGTSRSAGVGGSGLALAKALGSGWPTGIETQMKGFREKLPAYSLEAIPPYPADQFMAGIWS